MLAIIGGTGFAQFVNLQDIEAETLQTSFGSTYIERGLLGKESVIFLPRHGNPPEFPPHKINYRANIQSLSDLGVERIISTTAVGSVDPELEVCDLVVPDQIIDYTFGREHTFHEDEIQHIDFTYPYDDPLRRSLLAAAEAIPQCTIHSRGVYGCTQGPRLETAAEVNRMQRDGCTIVGMTAMPEAALAREKGIAYAGISFVVNAGAGINDQVIDMDALTTAIANGTSMIAAVINAYVRSG